MPAFTSSMLLDHPALAWVLSLSQPFVLINAEGQVHASNEAFEEWWEILTGKSPAIDSLNRAFGSGSSAQAEAWRVALVQGEVFHQICVYSGVAERIQLEASPLDPRVLPPTWVGGYMVACKVSAQSELETVDGGKDEDVLFTHLSECAVLIDSQGNVQDASPAWCDALGYRQAEVIGRSYWECCHPAEVATLQQALIEPEAPCSPTPQAHRLRHHDGTWYWVESQASLSPDGDGVLLISRDITTYVLRQEAQAKHEASLTAAGRMANVGIWEYDVTTGVIWWSEQVYVIYDWPKEQPLTLESILTQYAPASYACLATAVERAQGEGLGYDLELELTNKTPAGQPRYIRTIGEAIVVDGVVVKIVGAVQEITVQREVEDTLREQTAILNQTQRIAKLGGWGLDPTTGYTVWTDEVYRIHEADRTFDHNQAKGIEFYHPEDQPHLIAALQGSLEHHQEFDIECRMITAKGRQIWVRVLGSPRVNDAGEVTYLHGLFQDITEAKEAEQVLRASEEMLRHLNDNMREAFWLRSADNEQIKYISLAYEEIWGMSRERLYAEPNSFFEAIHPDDLGTSMQAAAFYPQTGQYDLEHRIVRPDGSIRWVWVRQHAVYDQAGTIVSHTGIAADITARKQTEEQVNLLQSVVEKAENAIVITSAHPVNASAHGPEIIYVNPAFMAMTGYDAADIIGQSPRILQGPESDPQQIARIRKAMLNWETVEAELINYRKDGTAYWSNIVVTPIADQHGHYTHWVSIQRDVTARKAEEFELIRAKESAERASLAKSQFLSTMSHEIRTPLNAIIGMTGLMDETPLNPEQSSFLRTIRQGGEALLSVINDILDYSKIESGQMELETVAFDLLNPIEDTLDLLAEKAHRKGLELLYEVVEPLPHRVIGDVTRLRQVLVNLVSNALKFTEAGEVKVSVEQRSLDPYTGRTELAFAVSDTGMGIPADSMDRLFQSFSQVDASITRKHGGTGLGLAISRRLVELQGGKIQAESEEGKGATFSFTIQVVADLKAAPLSLPSLKGKQVWLLDDNATNLRIQESVLGRLGLQIESFLYPNALLNHCDQHPLPDLMILDMHFANTTGLALGQQLRKQYPELALILLSSDNLIQTAPQKAVFQAILQKPVRNQDLWRTVSRLLSGEGVIETAPEQAQAPIDLSDFHILLVEDNKVNQRVAQRMLQTFQAKVETANNGQEAVEYVQMRDFDLILMDMQMPVMDGLEATRRIRALTQQPQPLILAMTANASRDDRTKCLAAGMNDFITKPIKLAQLREHLRQWLLPSPQKEVVNDTQALRP
jgi:PAS domain S-box-containing protein